jgi:hypothetical protein
MISRNNEKADGTGRIGQEATPAEGVVSISVNALPYLSVIITRKDSVFLKDVVFVV